MSKIKVNVTVKETVLYNQEIELTQEEYKELECLNGEDICCNQDGYSKIEAVIDRTNVFDNTGEWVEFEIIKL